jgi:peptide/nickel transport system substrate-binding protein
LNSQASQAGWTIGGFPPKRVGVSLVLCWLAIGLALSCSKTPVRHETDNSLVIGLGVGRTAQAAGVDHIVDTLSSEPLVSVGWNGRPVPRLAVEWNSTNNGKTLTLRLRKGVVFHDGTRLTPDVVVSQLRRSLKQGGYSRVESINTDGDDKIVIRFKEPDAFFLGKLSEANIKIGTDRKVGTGPFVLQTRTPEIALEAFPNYHLGRSSIQKVLVRTYETPRASWAAMMRGEVSLLYELNRDAIEFVEAGSRVATYSFPRPYYIPIVFNINHPILGRREVRQAINEAIDRPEIVAKALYNRGQPADGPVWPNHWAYNAATRPYSYNPDAARIRLDAAGFPLVSSGNEKMPSRFKFRCLFYGEDAMFERIALVVQKQLFQIGIDAEMVPVTLDEIQTRHATGDFEAFLISMVSGRSLDWVYWFWRSSSATGTGIARPGYTAADVVLDRLRVAQSDDDTRMALADLQRILYEDPPAAFLVRPDTARAVDESFVVPEDEKGRDIFTTNIWQWKRRSTLEARRAK